MRVLAHVHARAHVICSSSCAHRPPNYNMHMQLVDMLYLSMCAVCAVNSSYVLCVYTLTESIMFYSPEGHTHKKVAV
jgi:hypothetical protein